MQRAKKKGKKQLYSPVSLLPFNPGMAGLEWMELNRFRILLQFCMSGFWISELLGCDTICLEGDAYRGLEDEGREAMWCLCIFQ